jgi:carotenoid cleavage dioxygenase
MDERRYTRAYRYAYTTGWGAGRPGAQPTLRHDLQANAIAEHHYGPDAVPGESVFAARPGDTAEDAGWLLTCVYRVSEDRSDLVIVDARNFGGDPQAIVHLPGRVPLGFHGNWITDAGPRRP